MTLAAARRTSDRSRTVRLVGAATLGATIFLVDALTPPDIPFAALYVLVLLLAGWDASVREILTWTAGCVFLATLCFLYEVDLAHDLSSDVRFGIAITAIGCTALLVARNSAAEAIRLSEVRYRTIFDTLAVAICEYDFRPVRAAIDAARASGVSDLQRHIAEHPEFIRAVRRSVRVTDANDTAVRLLELPGKAEFFNFLGDFLADDDSLRQCIVAIDEGRGTLISQTRVRSFNGELLPVIMALSFPPGAGLSRITGCLVDISDRLKMQATIDRTRTELDRALRVASLGEVSASIAHEVNQPLSAVMSYAHASRRWLNRKPPDVPEAHAAINSVLAAAETASEVVKRIHKLLGKIAPERAPVRIDTMISEAVQVVEDEAEIHDAFVVLELGAPDAVVMGDRILLQQVLINVLTNAIQAMEVISDRPRRVVVQSELVDGTVRIRVVDAGPGLAAEIAERAFEAFRTTKPRGSGLGLSICRSTVEAHDGSIAIENNTDSAGATVTIELPAATATAAQPSNGPNSDSRQPTSVSPSTGFSSKHTAPLSMT